MNCVRTLLRRPLNLIRCPFSVAVTGFNHKSLIGFENITILFENIHTNFLRKITKSRKSTPLYAELGRYPLDIIVKTRIIGFGIEFLFDKLKISP